ncbi:hypothetical protein EV715DRAFT_277953 [Schizophyllum commune]
MSTPNVYLVTGANRGLGFALVRLLATRPDVVVYATARKLDYATDLQALASESTGKVRLLELQSGDEAAHKAAIARIKDDVGRLDVVIANAGMVSHIGPMVEMPVQALRDHFEINTVGPLVLFKAAYPLLAVSHGKFAVISSWLGAERGANSPFGFTAYATSKAAVNFLVRRMHTECPDITALALHPGSVDTRMGDYTRQQDSRLANAPKISPEESARGILEGVIDTASRGVHGGRLWAKQEGEWGAVA